MSQGQPSNSAIEVSSGGFVDLYEPDAEPLNPEDIAQALAFMLTILAPRGPENVWDKIREVVNAT